MMKEIGWDSLPVEMQVAIFEKLSPTDLADAAQVSRDWNKVATDDQVVKAVFKRQYGVTDHPQVLRLAFSRRCVRKLWPWQYGSAVRSEKRWRYWAPLFANLRLLGGIALALGGCAGVEAAVAGAAAVALRLPSRYFEKIDHLRQVALFHFRTVGKFTVVGMTVGSYLSWVSQFGLRQGRRQPPLMPSRNALRVIPFRTLAKSDWHAFAQWERAPREVIERALYLKDQPDTLDRNAAFDLVRSRFFPRS